MSELSVRDTLSAVDIALQMSRLLTLDRVWTSYLDNIKPVAREDVPTLETLGNEMCALISKWPEHCKWLRPRVEALDEGTLAERFNVMVEASHLDGDYRLRARAKVEERGGFRTFVLDGIATLEEAADQEIATIQEKLAAIREAGDADGDISAWCAAFAAQWGLCGLLVGGPGFGVDLAIVGAESALSAC